MRAREGWQQQERMLEQQQRKLVQQKSGEGMHQQQQRPEGMQPSEGRQQTQQQQLQDSKSQTLNQRRVPLLRLGSLYPVFQSRPATKSWQLQRHRKRLRDALGSELCSTQDVDWKVCVQGMNRLIGGVCVCLLGQGSCPQITKKT